MKDSTDSQFVCFLNGKDSFVACMSFKMKLPYFLNLGVGDVLFSVYELFAFL